MNFESMSLAELFAAADKIGDKYLSAEEIAVRESELATLKSAVSQLIVEADNAKAIAQQGIDALARQRDRITAISTAALDKYQLL